MSNSRENILSKVRNALSKKVEMHEKPDFASEIYFKPKDKSSLEFFIENFHKTKGDLHVCTNEKDFLEKISAFVKVKSYTSTFAWEEKVIHLLSKSDVKFSTTEQDFISADLGITFCESLIARTGSIILSSASTAGRRLNIFPHSNLVIAYTSQIVDDIKDGLIKVKAAHRTLPSMVSLTTGPSRTADIEKTLVLGAHGPKDLILFLINDSSNK